MSASPRPSSASRPASSRSGIHPFHVVGDKYIRAVSEGADCLPFLIPALGGWHDIDAVLDRLDGLLDHRQPVQRRAAALRRRGQRARHGARPRPRRHPPCR